MSFGRRLLPIRWRLALISATLTFLILLVFALAVGQLTTSRIRSDFNGQLATAADDLQQQFRIQVNRNTGQILGHQPDLDVFAASEHAVIRINAEDGTTILKTRKGPDLGFVPGAATFEAGGYRVAQRVVPLNTGGTLTLQYARKLSDVAATEQRVRTFLFLGVCGGTLAALLAGLWLARRAMRPIEELTTTAREISRTGDTGLRIPRQEADDEIAELASTLDEMLQSIDHHRAETEAMLVRQRQFVADASHELRTPLTSVMANLELLVDVLDGDRGDAARSALRSSHRMRRLVADLLLLARADARREVPHEPVDLGQVLVEAAAELEPATESHELLLDVHGPAWVLGARDDLHRLALNLMENALRHTPAGTTVRASVAATDGTALLVVADDGPGIPDDQRERVFERFVRGEGDRGGSFGLGLPIVRAVAQAHGGTVGIGDGPGARFEVRLPATTPPAGAGDRPVAGGTASGV